MPAVITWFSPNDTLLVDHTAIIRIARYSEPLRRHPHPRRIPILAHTKSSDAP
jgi:hypothetical protein